MKKLLAMLMVLAMMMGFGATAMAEDDWVDYSSVVAKLMYTSTEEVVESDTSRAVACGAVFLDFVMAELGYELGGGDYFYMVDVGDNFMLFVAPVLDHATVNSIAILYNMNELDFSMLPSEHSAETAFQLVAEDNPTYTVSTQTVAAAAEALLDYLVGEE